MENFGDLERDSLKDYAYICAQKEIEQWWQWEEEQKVRKPAIITLNTLKDEDRIITREVQTNH
jgi:hypothetical protein